MKGAKPYDVCEWLPDKNDDTAGSLKIAPDITTILHSSAELSQRLETVYHSAAKSEVGIKTVLKSNIEIKADIKTVLKGTVKIDNKRIQELHLQHYITIHF